MTDIVHIQRSTIERICPATATANGHWSGHLKYRGGRVHEAHLRNTMLAQQTSASELYAFISTLVTSVLVVSSLQ